MFILNTFLLNYNPLKDFLRITIFYLIQVTF